MKKIISVLLILVLAFSLVGCGNKAYKKGIDAFKNGDYENAMFYLSQDPGYKDSQEKINEARIKLIDEYADAGNSEGVFDLLRQLSINEIHTYDNLIAEFVRKDLQAVYDAKSLDSFFSVMYACETNYKKLLNLGFDDYDPMVGTLKKLSEDDRALVTVKTYLEWFPDSSAEINKLMDDVTDKMLNGTADDVYKAGEALYNYGNSILTKYSSDDYSVRIGVSLRDGGDDIMMLAKATSQSAASKHSDAFSNHMDNLTAVLTEVMDISLELLDDLDAVNDVYKADIFF